MILVNGESRQVSGGLSLDSLLTSLDLRPEMIVVEHNGDIIRRDRYPFTRVEDGDMLELVHFVGGG
jgi:thiamine biosynthesis protein ThiS